MKCVDDYDCEERKGGNRYNDDGGKDCDDYDYGGGDGKDGKENGDNEDGSVVLQRIPPLPMIPAAAAAAALYDDNEDRVPTVDVTSVVIEPNQCELSERLELEVDFSLDRPVCDANWVVKYMVDSVQRRHIIVLGQTEPEDYPEGESSFLFSVSHIDVSNVKPGSLTNAGLLIATLQVDGTEIMDLNMVVQVRKAVDGGFTRCIFSPLE